MPENYLQIQQLKQVQQAIENFFYRNKFNLALYKVISSRKTVNFKKKIKDGLYNQVLYFAKVEKIDQIVGVSGLGKAVKTLTETDLLERLEKLWVPLYGFLDEESVHDYMLWAGEKGGQGAMGKLRVSRDFELTNNKLKSGLISLADALTNQIEITTKDWLARTIEQGFRENLSHFEIAKLIRNSANSIALERSEVIAEQEAAIAVGEIELEVYKRNGVKEFRWETMRDERACILGGATKVFTLDGLKKIKDVLVGDFVLTHKDRYRKVLRTYKRKYIGKVVRFTLSPKGVSDNRIGLTVTEEHPILINRQGKQLWMKASDIREDDFIYIMGKKCICSKIIPFAQTKCPSCWSKEVNRKRWEDPLQKEKLVRFNKLYNKAELMEKALVLDKISNPAKYLLAREKANLTKKMRWDNDEVFRNKRIEINRKTAKYPNHPFKLIHQDKKRQTEILKLAHKALGEKHLGQTYLERKIKWFLDKEGIEYLPQWFYRYNGRWAWADFYLPGANCVIEADGCLHLLPDIQSSDTEKDSFLREKGIGILRFTDNQIRYNFVEVASKIKRLNCILAVPTSHIKTWELKRKSNGNMETVYNLEVEEDQSYVVNGIVVHNCVECLSNEEAGIVKVGELFPSGVVAPPSHARCRCFLMPVTKETTIVWTGN